MKTTRLGGNIGMILYRTVGRQELKLIKASGYVSFPPRLPEQPIFYPVLHKQYAIEIASKWNVKDRNSGYKGFVTTFKIRDEYISKFDVRVAGANYHQEYWIPADELEEFNRNIIGKNRVIGEFG